MLLSGVPPPSVVWVGPGAVTPSAGLNLTGGYLSLSPAHRCIVTPYTHYFLLYPSKTYVNNREHHSRDLMLRSQSGEYRCEASNGYADNTVTSQVVPITVLRE